MAVTALDGVKGTVCIRRIALQWNQSQASWDRVPNIVCLTHGDTIALTLVSETSFISFISIIVIFIRIGWNVRWYRKTFPKGDWKLFQRPADIYMFSLFVFDFLLAISVILNIRWAHNGIVTPGLYCAAQGIITQIGEIGIALITLLLAVHTFIAALWRVGLQARGVALGMVCLACIFTVLWVILGAGTFVPADNDTPNPYWWCWISPNLGIGLQVGGGLLWQWIALVASPTLYIPLYFWAEGYLSVDEERWYKFRMSAPYQRVGYAQRRVALGMLLYPVANSLLLLPLFISRWLSGHHKVSTATTYGVFTVFNLSGAIDVLLFLIVRPQLLLFPRPEKLAEPDIQLAPHGTNSEYFSEHNSEPTSAALLVDEGSRNSAAETLVSSGRMSDDV